MIVVTKSRPAEITRDSIIVDSAHVTVDSHKDLLVRSNELEIALFDREAELAQYQHHLQASQQNLARAQERIELYQEKIKLYQRGWNAANSRSEQKQLALTMLALMLLLQNETIEDLSDHLAHTALFAFLKQQQVQALENGISRLEADYDGQIEDMELRMTVEVDVRYALESKLEESKAMLAMKEKEISNLQQQLVSALNDLDLAKSAAQASLQGSHETLEITQKRIADLEQIIAELQKEKHVNSLYEFLKACLPPVMPVLFVILLLILW